MRRLLPLLVVVLLAAACGDDTDAVRQPATEEGAVEAAIALQEAALRADEEGIRRGLSAECLDAIDDDELRAALAFLRLLTADLDIDDIEVRAEIEELEGDRAELTIEYLGADGQPLPEGDDGFSLSAEDMTLVHDGTRWVSEECEFDGSGDAGPSRCLDSSGQLAECPEPTAAGRGNPVPIGVAAYLGDGWMMRVVGVDPDAADAIEEASGFSTDLDPGLQAVLIDLELAYVGDAEPANPFSISMGGVGASNVAIDAFGCGFLPQPIDGSTNAFTGGLIRGQQCLPTPTDEVDTVLLYAEVFGADRVFFDLRGEPVDEALPSARGPVPGSTHEDARQTPVALGQATTVGDWTVTVTAADLDATEMVLAENDFVDAPEPDRRFVVLDYTASFDGDEPANSNAVQPELLTEANLTVFADCTSTLDDAFDGFAEVFPGGQLSGRLCYEVADDDVDGLVAMVQLDIFDDDITFLALR